MYTIILEQLKHIKELTFNMPNKKGVYLLTGGNGVGKSTVLTAMARIGDVNAFAHNFKSLANKSTIDDYNGASITYKNSNTKKSVKYVKKEHRWSPTPKTVAVSDVIRFTEVIYLKADHTRIGSSVKELTGKLIKEANLEISNAMKEILDNEKFKSLFNTPEDKGRNSNKAALIKDKSKYYSDKNFSTGEIVLYNLVKKISGVGEKSLILIDEVDLSLNSKTQINLLNYLEEFAERKRCIIILSTHSPVLIKSVNNKNIYHLEQRIKGKVECINPCYSSYALNSFTSRFDTNIDYIFTVEDAEAKILLDGMIDKYFETISRKDRPKYRTLLIGGYPQVLNFLDLNKGFFTGIKMYAFFDADVKDTLEEIKINVKNAKDAPKDGDIDIIQSFERNKNSLAFLPITPELGLVDNIIEKSEVFAELLLGFNNVNTNKILHTVNEKKYKCFTNDRKGAKAKVDIIVDVIAKDAGLAPNLVRKDFYKYYVEKILDLNILKEKIGIALSISREDN